MNDRTAMIRFPGSLGTALAARLDSPEGRPAAYALFAHCFTCSKEALAAVRISRALTARGIAVLRFDFTGLGGSEGEFANTNFSSNVGDLVAAAQWLREHHEAPSILIGHSLGGAAVLAAAASVPEASAIATIAAPADPVHVRRLFEPSVQDIEREGQARVVLADRAFTIKKQFIDDLAAHRMQERIASLRKALLIFHSPRDDVVDIDNASRIFVAAKHPKSFVSLDTADHLLTRKEDAVYVAAVLAAWAGRYIDGAVKTGDTRVEPPGTVTVAETGRGKFMQEVRVGSHRLIADEPASYGGDDAGPSPYDLLVAALGACTAMTVRLYGDAKQLPLEHVAVRLRHDKVHAKDCAECETKDGKIDRIEREIELVGELDDAQRARLVEIANRCPVHRTLQSEVWIPTRLRS
jgi:putative redox protein